ncbi:MAG: SDR family oxidoreductase [Immundisolibacter sp.]|uniref:SDR family NAD(P)-dependent oxidoreductase n=1 Tax=Immundisolibacter sp. TaxID=1934948 RepID=UPI0019907551|nr:SDR family oxidoreductase [Immundisolibacter sp.]MBC7161466.1 SDR family oxidoreductase [Immundisolibacter sp.]
MKGLLDGRVVIVTGAARGIGQAYALALAEHGAKVAVADLLDPADTVNKINASHPESAIGIAVDVANYASCEAMVQKTLDAFGSVTGLINNAALFGVSAKQKGVQMRPFTQIPEEDWDLTMAINVKGPWNCCKAVVPHMMEKRYGKIVNISSQTIGMGTPMILDYVTSKGAVATMARCLARELGPYGIRVNALTPGFTQSQAVKDLMGSIGGAGDAMTAQYAAQACLGRPQVPEDLVGTAVYLMSELSDFVTGQLLNVDGGQSHTGM